jgi:molecular chaperone DnaK (HSP70)
VTYALSIDAGTTFTAAATWRDGVATPVTLGEDADAVPSVLYLREDGVLLIGEAAERRAVSDPGRVAREFKRRMGDADVPISVGNQTFWAHELTGHLVGWVLDRVREREGEEPTHVVLTHPAAWGDHRRAQLEKAAAIAGLESLGLLPEPIAAATYYASVRPLEPEAVLAVYDFGGGTFDSAVLRKTADGFELCGEPGGDDEVGGIDFDHAVLRHILVTAGIDKTTLDVSNPEILTAVAQLQSESVKAKKALTDDVLFDVPVLLPGTHARVRLTREEFEDLPVGSFDAREETVRDRVKRTVEVLSLTLRDANVEPSSLRGVLLVGGTSRIPLVSRTIAAELGAPTLVDVHPKHAVCLGAAVVAAARLSPAPTQEYTSPKRRPDALPDIARQMLIPLPTPEQESLPPLPATPEQVRVTAPLDTMSAPTVPHRPRRPVSATDIPVIVRTSGTRPDPRVRWTTLLILMLAILLLVGLSLAVAPR